MVQRKRRKPEGKGILAKRAIKDLFKEADRIFPKDPDLAKKYVLDARKVGTRLRVTLTSTQKRKFCKQCGAFWKQGKNVRVRMTQHNVVYTCLDCGSIKRIGKIR